jgi:hypothetical protein
VSKPSSVEGRDGTRAAWAVFLALMAGCGSGRVATTANQDGSVPGSGGDAASIRADGGDADGTGGEASPDGAADEGASSSSGGSSSGGGSTSGSGGSLGGSSGASSSGAGSCPPTPPVAGGSCSSPGATCPYSGCKGCVCESNGTWACPGSVGDCASCPTTVVAGASCNLGPAVVCLEWAFCGRQCSCGNQGWSCAACAGGSCDGVTCSGEASSCPTTKPHDGDSCGPLPTPCLYPWPAGCAQATCSCDGGRWACSYADTGCVDAG